MVIVEHNNFVKPGSHIKVIEQFVLNNTFEIINSAIIFDVY